MKPAPRGAALALVLLASAGCTAHADADLDPVERFRADVEQLRATETVVLPEVIPPHLTEAWVSRQERLTEVSFYSENAPVVTICTGLPRDCGELSDDVELRVVELGQVRALLSLGRRESPSPKPALDGELARFWDDVALTTRTPGWVSTD